MNAAEILALARDQCVTVKLDGKDLDIVADHEPDPDLLSAIAGRKPEILSLLRAERGSINRWIAARIVDYPRDRCLHCRRPIIAGQKWIDVASGDALARFHRPCHAAWLAEQETKARKAMGLNQRETSP
jgi:hypothetical protein